MLDFDMARSVGDQGGSVNGESRPPKKNRPACAGLL
jgi:hypothetical protein